MGADAITSVSRAYYIAVGVTWLSHLAPMLVYIFLGFTLTFLGEVFIASLLQLLILMHGVCLALLSNIMLDDGGFKPKLIKILLTIDEVLITPKLIRIAVSALTSHTSAGDHPINIILKKLEEDNTKH